MKEYLKIKVVSLAAEAKLIRHEEQKAKWKARAARGRANAARAIANQTNQVYTGPFPENIVATALPGLHQHRVVDVRREARAANLAYGFMRGNPYSIMERYAHTQPDWGRVSRLITKYAMDDERIVQQKLAEWMDAAKTHLNESHA